MRRLRVVWVAEELAQVLIGDIRQLCLGVVTDHDQLVLGRGVVCKPDECLRSDRLLSVKAPGALQILDALADGGRHHVCEEHESILLIEGLVSGLFELQNLFLPGENGDI